MNYTNQLLLVSLKSIKHSCFKVCICSTQVTDMKLISRQNKDIRYLLWVIDIFSKYARVVALKEKKDVTITNAFQRRLYESGHKPNKILADEGSEFFTIDQ